jgi:hypothetical protein
MAFAVGDRVARQISLDKPDQKFGSIVAVGETLRGLASGGYPLYSVLWDGTTVPEHNYMEIGLQKVGKQ